MKRAFVIGITVAALGAGAMLNAQSPRTVEAQLKAAQQKAEVEGDLKGAIEEYKKVVAAAGRNRALAAQALVQMAECYQKLGDAEAQKIYGRILEEFADQKSAVAEAHARLALLRPPPALPSQAVRLIWTGPDAFRCAYGALSPDGRYLNCSGIIRDLKENTSRRLIDNRSGGVFNASVSPDGQQVAYEWGSETDFKYDLRLLPFNASQTTQPRILHRNDETTRIRPFAWTPDRAQLLVLRSLKDGTNQIALISVQDGSIRVLKSLPWQYASLSLSPDGRYLAYDAPVGDTNSQREIFVLSADGSRETAVVQNSSDDHSPLWSPDGSDVLFLSDRTGTTSLWKVSIDGGRALGPAELVKADLGRVRLEGISRTGTLFYLVSGALRTNVYTAELDANMKVRGAPQIATDRFINSNLQPSWSPNGQYLAFYSSRGRAARSLNSTALVIRTVETGEDRDLPLPPGVVLGNLLPAPTWFPDGRSVLVLVGTPGKGGAFHRVDVASGRSELLYARRGIFGQGGLGANAISPDGTTIFFIASVDDPPTADRKLVRFEIGTRSETVLKSGQVFMALALAPDGTQLAYKWAKEGCHIEVMSAAGGESRELFRGTSCSNPNQLAWSPDHRHLLFVTGQNPPNVLWRLPLVGGEPEQLGISAPGQLMYPQVHPAGARMTFGVLETGASEVWALENFLPAPTAKR